MDNCLTRKLYGFKGGKMWRINFLKFSKSSLFFLLIGPCISFVVNRKNIKFQVKNY